MLDRLVRRRAVPVPTLAGWAVVLVAAAAALAGLARAAPGFLALDAPVGRGLLVVEGWLPRSALAAAAAELRRGRYDALVVAGGRVVDPEWEGGFATYAERAGAFLRSQDLGGRELFVVPGPEIERERTFEAALAVRRWLDATGRRADAVDVFSYGPHARRSRDLYRLALGRGVAVGSRAAAPAEYDLARWWRRSRGARDVVGEALGWAWAACCFWPDAR